MQTAMTADAADMSLQHHYPEDDGSKQLISDTLHCFFLFCCFLAFMQM